MIEFLHSNHLIQKISKIEKTGSKLINWALKKIAWNSFEYGLDYFDLNLYKTVKIKTVSTVLMKLYLNKQIIILIIAFI